MQVNIVKQSDYRIPRSFIESWMKSLVKELHKRTDHDIRRLELTIAFVEDKTIRSLNKQFRHKDKTTDILSFEGFSPEELGELVLCGEVVVGQAEDHELKTNEEMGYLLIHGVLHLLGYEHEESPADAKQMFDLQDQLFDILRKRFF